MSWITLTATDIRDRLGAPEYQAVGEAALAEGQADPWPALIDDATEHVRGQIGSNPKNTLGAAGTIPAACKRHLISLIIWDALNRFGLSTLLGETRKLDYEKADAYFRSVARGDIAVEQPETAGEEAFRNREGAFATADVELSTKRRATRDRLDGLG